MGTVTGMRTYTTVMLCAALSFPAAAQADIFGSKGKKNFSNQTKVLDNRASQQYKASVRLQPTQVVTPTKWGTAKAYDGRYKGQFLDMAKSAALRDGSAGERSRSRRPRHYRPDRRAR